MNAPRRAGPFNVRAAAATLAVVLGILALTACSNSPVVDVPGLEDELAQVLQGAYEADGLTFFGVDCPGDLADAVIGHVFACTADVERQFVRIRVEVTDRQGGHDWTTLDVVHDLDNTEALVADEMTDALRDTIALDCGSPRIRVLPIGSSFTCEAVDSGGNSVRVLLTVRGAGQTGWEVLD